MNIEDIKDAFEALTEREKHFVSDIINNIHGIDIESIKIPEIQAEPDPVIEEPEIASKKIEQDDGFDEFDEDFIEPENPVLTVAKDEFDEDFDEEIEFAPEQPIECEEEPEQEPEIVKPVISKEEQEDIDDFNEPVIEEKLPELNSARNFLKKLQQEFINSLPSNIFPYLDIKIGRKPYGYKDFDKSNRKELATEIFTLGKVIEKFTDKELTGYGLISESVKIERGKNWNFKVAGKYLLPLYGYEELAKEI